MVHSATTPSKKKIWFDERDSSWKGWVSHLEKEVMGDLVGKWFNVGFWERRANQKSYETNKAKVQLECIQNIINKNIDFF